MTKPMYDADTVLDFTLGEPIVLQTAFKKHYGLEPIGFQNRSDLEYTSPAGSQKLVAALEKKYQAKVVITNGAKQGLLAALYAFKNQGVNNCFLPTPYWSVLPHLLNFSKIEKKIILEKAESFLLTLPNNPDGQTYDSEQLRQNLDFCQNYDIPVIHDAVYYNRCYLTPNYPLVPIGDLQIFSASKYYGLSSLRVGVVVCHNDRFYQDVCDYVELTTTGVSWLSQQFLLQIFQRDLQSSKTYSEFSTEVRKILTKRKETLKNIVHPNIFIPSDLEKVPGPFAWVETTDPQIFVKNHINVLAGELYGELTSNRVRINLAVPQSRLDEMVKRLNADGKN